MWHDLSNLSNGKSRTPSISSVAFSSTYNVSNLLASIVKVGLENLLKVINAIDTSCKDNDTIDLKVTDEEFTLVRLKHVKLKSLVKLLNLIRSRELILVKITLTTKLKLSLSKLTQKSNTQILIKESTKMKISRKCKTNYCS